jgi:hypothetical protein
MQESHLTASLESLVHGGFFQAAEKRISQDIQANGNPADTYKRLLYSIYYRQVANLNKAREILGLDSIGSNTDPNLVFNYLQASLFSGDYSQASRLISALLLQHSSPSAPTPKDPLLDHLARVNSLLATITNNWSSEVPFAKGVHPTYYSESFDNAQLSPSLVSDNPLSIQKVDAIYCPNTKTWYDIERQQPIVQLLQPTHDFSGFFGNASPNESPDIDRLLQESTHAIDSAALYLPASMHYGHFLTQCGGYLHPLARSHDLIPFDQSVTCLLGGQLPDQFKQIISMGARKPVVFSELPTSPLRARNLIVSGCSWVEWHYCNKSYTDIFLNASNAISSTDVGAINSVDTSPSHDRIYLSRSRLKAGLRLSVNEVELEQRLEAMGFAIVHPQELKLGQLIALLNSAKIITGSMGSAMHNILFRSSSEPLTVINIAHFLPPYNFVMIEAALGIANNLYLRASQETRSADGSNLLYFDIKKIEDGIAAAIEHKC